MRLEDGICALEVAKDGILVGEGISLLKVINSIDNVILCKALEVPFNKIMENAIGNYEDIKNEIKNSNYEEIYNFALANFESINDTTIIDPLKVVIEAIKNAISIASMLLTTNYLVINENIKIDKNIL